MCRCFGWLLGCSVELTQADSLITGNAYLVGYKTPSKLLVLKHDISWILSRGPEKGKPRNVKHVLHTAFVSVLKICPDIVAGTGIQCTHCLLLSYEDKRQNHMHPDGLREKKNYRVYHGATFSNSGQRDWAQHPGECLSRQSQQGYLCRSPFYPNRHLSVGLSFPRHCWNYIYLSNPNPGLHVRPPLNQISTLQVL